MKRQIAFITVLLALMLTLASCTFIGGGGTTVPPEDDFKYTRIVAASDVDIMELADLRAAIFNLQGAVNIISDSEAAEDGEIVIGDTSRAITNKAKSKLESSIKSAKAEVGYIIYAEGKSVAVYWSYEDMKAIAISEFLKLCVNESGLELDEGVLSVKCYTEDGFNAEKEWMELADIADPEVYAALREISEYYDGDKILGWIANLWDDEIGAFYFSASARDNEPFRPDIESTNQALGWLQNNNVLKNQNELPNEMKHKMVEFAKSMQSSTDGYFYHEQWPKGTDKLNVDRYGRDLSWAAGIISRLTVDTDGDGVEEKQYPNYCTPSGVKCELHKDGGSCSYTSSTTQAGSGLSSAVLASASSLTVSINDSVSAAVSRVGSASEIVAIATARPDYSSAEAFVRWLEETNTNIKQTSGNAQMINAQQDVIISKGYCDELLDFLDGIQQEVYDEQTQNGETPTGLWQYYDDYHAVWGLLKYTPFYNDSTYGRELKYAEQIVATCLRVIMLPADGRFQANDIYNQWQGMQALLNNVKKYNPDKLESLYAMVREGAADYISNSIKKLEYFKSPEGAFSFLSTGRSSTMLYGTPVSLGEYEGDVNATVLLCSMYRCMFTCLGYKVVHLCDDGDFDWFIDTVENLEPVVKNEAPPIVTIDFESDDSPFEAKLDNISGGASMSLINKGYTIKGVVESGTGNHVVQYNTAASDDTYGDGLKFDITGAIGNNCIVAEMDICMVSNSGNNDMLQLRIGDFYRLRFNRNGNAIRIYEMVERSGEVKTATITNSLKMGEWFRIRVECYKTDDENPTPYFKIFINNEYVTTSSCAWGINGADLYESASTVLLRAYKTAENEILIDNCFFHAENRVYDPDDHTIFDEREDW